jgi:tripartite ATP-independent transporter DctM subunit
MSVFLLLTFFVLSLLGVPLAIALGLSVASTLFLFDLPLVVIPRLMYTSMNSFLLVAVPLFILAGLVMEKGGVADAIFNASRSIVGRWRGGLGHVNIVASFIFGGISGSSVADVGSLGPLEIRAMTNDGYPKDYSAALTMVTATLSSVVPPSILMIIGAVAAEQSVGGCLAGGFGPAIVLATMFMLLNYAKAVKNNYGTIARFSRSEIVKANLSALPALLSPIIILGGIFGGFVTPTESAALAVLYTLLIAVCVYRKMELKDFPTLIISAGRTTGTILFIAMTAAVSTYIFSVDRLPAQVSKLILGFTVNPQVVLLLMGVIFIIIGMFMDIVAAILLVTPVLFPTAMQVGIDPVHFVVYEVVALSIGLSTPPVGVCLFATSLVANMKIEQIVKAAIPFFIVMLAFLVVIALVPDITLFFVQLVM